MKTTIEINKEDYPSPGEIGESINQMETRASMSTYYSHPTIDDAIEKLKQFRELMMGVYIAETDTERRAVRRLVEDEDYTVLVVQEKDS